MLFRDRVFDVAGQKLTLDQIERDKIGTLTRDPRVEFLLSCGSRSCALLPPDVMAQISDSPEVKGSAQPFDDAMADGMRRWFSRPDNLRVDRTRGVVEIGQLLQLDWHGGGPSSVRASCSSSSSATRSRQKIQRPRPTCGPKSSASPSGRTTGVSIACAGPSSCRDLRLK